MVHALFHFSSFVWYPFEQCLLSFLVHSTLSIIYPFQVSLCCNLCQLYYHLPLTKYALTNLSTSLLKCDWYLVLVNLSLRYCSVDIGVCLTWWLLWLHCFSSSSHRLCVICCCGLGYHAPPACHAPRVLHLLFLLLYLTQLM